LNIDKAKKETVKLLKDLIEINSENPPGNEAEIAGYAKEFLEGVGVKTELVPLAENRDSLVGLIPGSGQGSIVLCGHLDTVRADAEKWETPPFQGVVRDGKIYGRGASDMKGGCAVIMEAAKLLADSADRLEKTLIFALTADEEAGYGGAKTLVEAGLLDEAEFLIVTEPTDGRPYIGEKGELWIEANFFGQAAHGSTPERGINTILPGAEFCRRLHREVERLPEDELLGRTTLNIGQFNGGWQPNVVPDETTIKLDFRPISEGHMEKVMELVGGLGEETAEEVGARFSRQVTERQRPLISDREDPYVKNFLAAARGEASAAEEATIVPYCTDAAAVVPQLEIPLVIYGPGSIDLAHQPDEYIELESLGEALETLKNFLQRYVRG